MTVKPHSLNHEQQGILQLRIMIRLFISILIISLFAGCAANDYSKEEKTQLENNRREFRENIVEPILLLTISTCVYKDNNTAWPGLDLTPGEHSHFSTYKAIKSSSNEFSNSFTLKHSVLAWTTRFKFTNINNKKICNFTIRAGKRNQYTALSYNGEIDVTEAGKLTDHDKNDIHTIAYVMSSYLYLPYKLIEHSAINPKQKRREDFNASLTEAIIKVGICILLDVDEKECSL